MDMTIGCRDFWFMNSKHDCEHSTYVNHLPDHMVSSSWISCTLTCDSDQMYYSTWQITDACLSMHNVLSTMLRLSERSHDHCSCSFGNSGCQHQRDGCQHQRHGCQHYQDRPYTIVGSWETNQPTGSSSRCNRVLGGDRNHLCPNTQHHTVTNEPQLHPGILNIRSINKQTDNVLDLIQIHNLNITALTETWYENIASTFDQATP